MKETILDYLKAYSLDTPESPAIVCNERAITYTSFWSLIESYSKILLGYNIPKGSRVVIKSSQTIEYISLFFSVQRIGAVPIPTEKSTPVNRLYEIAKLMDAATIIAPSAPTQEVITNSIKYIDFGLFNAQSVNESSPLTLAMPIGTDVGVIMFTTGTTGKSKGVVLSHAAFLSSAIKLSNASEYQGEMMVVTAPLNHVKGMWHSSMSWSKGGTVYILDGLIDLKAFFRALDYPCSKISLCISPIGLRTLMMCAKDKLSSYKNKIVFLHSGSAPLTEKDKSDACEVLPYTRNYNIYGSSESGLVAIYDFNRYKGHEKCVGFAMEGTKIMIVDDDNNEIVSSKDHLGSISMSSDSQMNGYYKDPSATADVLRDNIIYTNDVGYIDNDGLVYVVGRKDDVINIGGLKIAPSEVESVAFELDMVKDCICVESVDNYENKRLKLIVVPNHTEEFDSKLIHKYLLIHLERYKVPSIIEEAASVERTFNGKLNRKYYR